MSTWDNEKPPKDTRLLPEGERALTIVAGEVGVSKAGNPQFILDLKDGETGIITKVYLIRTPGKRWNLKQMLEAVGLEKSEDENYNYLPELLNKTVIGEVQHEPNTYINRQGNTVTTTQHRIVAFKKFSPDDISWEN